MESTTFEKTPINIQILFLVFILFAVVYFHWRIHTLNPDAWIFSGLMFAAECYGLCTGLAHIMMTWRLSVRKTGKPAPDQTVDVFIPTLSESIDIVRRTVRAAIQMEYPHQTWLLDDGNRPVDYPQFRRHLRLLTPDLFKCLRTHSL